MKLGGDQESRRQLFYLCLQPTREGQASHVHVHEIIAGLRRRAWSVRLIEPPAPSPGRFDPLRRAMHIVLAQARFILAVVLHRPDVAYVRSHFAAIPASLVLRLLKVRTVQELNGPVDDAYDSWPWLRRFERVVRFSVAHQLAWAQEVIAVSPAVAQYARQLGRLKHHPIVIGNGADPDHFNPRAISRVTYDGLYAVFVGALAKWRGIGTLIDATQLVEWPPGVTLVVVGDGIDRQRVRDASTEGQIVWIPRVAHADVPGLIAGARVAVVPQLASVMAGSPVKLFEAMACAVPVVVSDLPGIADVVRDADCGVVVPAGDAPALARAVRGIVDGVIDGPALGRCGRDAIIDRYSWDARARATDKLLRRVLASRDGLDGGGW